MVGLMLNVGNVVVILMRSCRDILYYIREERKRREGSWGLKEGDGCSCELGLVVMFVVFYLIVGFLFLGYFLFFYVL